MHLYTIAHICKETMNALCTKFLSATKSDLIFWFHSVEMKNSNPNFNLKGREEDIKMPYNRNTDAVVFFDRFIQITSR